MALLYFLWAMPERKLHSAILGPCTLHPAKSYVCALWMYYCRCSGFIVCLLRRLRRYSVLGSRWGSRRRRSNDIRMCRARANAIWSSWRWFGATRWARITMVKLKIRSSPRVITLRLFIYAEWIQIYRLSGPFQVVPTAYFHQPGKLVIDTIYVIR